MLPFPPVDCSPEERAFREVSSMDLAVESEVYKKALDKLAEHASLVNR